MTVPAIGLDLSLQATGIAVPDGTTRIIRTRNTGTERLAEICERIAMRIDATPRPLIAVIETPFTSPKFLATGLRLAELGGAVRVMLHRHHIPHIDVAPAQLKRWATGNGNAPKETMIAAAVERGADVGQDDNRADAWWLWAAAQARYDNPSAWPALGSLLELPWPALRTVVAARHGAP